MEGKPTSITPELSQFSKNSLGSVQKQKTRESRNTLRKEIFLCKTKETPTGWTHFIKAFTETELLDLRFIKINYFQMYSYPFNFNIFFKIQPQRKHI